MNQTKWKRNKLAILLTAAWVTAGAGAARAHEDHDSPASPASHNTSATGSVRHAVSDEKIAKAAEEMAQAADNLWKALTPEQQKKAQFPFDDNERFNWHFIPRERKGLPW